MPDRTGLSRQAPISLLMLLLLLSGRAVHATPITLDESFAGNVNFVVTGASLRTQPNSGDSCAVSSTPVSAPLSGIPAGSTIEAAFLYWGGSGATADTTVTFDGSNVSADQQFSETFNQSFYNLEYFGGVADVTAQVSAKGNGTYSLGDLNVTTTDQGGGAFYCTSEAVVAGWGLLVVYDNPAEDFRVVNIFDGLRLFRGSQITLTPSNFQVPSSPVNGKQAILTWEGDAGNSGSLNGQSENLEINGNPLTDGLNPLNNQFNSTINSRGTDTSYGVDFDSYPIDPYISSGDTSATTVYSSGGDLVLLTMEAFSITNTPSSDLSILKSLSSTLQAGNTGQYRFQVSNNGPLEEPGPITVTDTLDSRLTYDGSSGSGWSCSTSGQDVTCNHPGPLADGGSLPDLFIDVAVQGGTSGDTISNTGEVSGQNFDNVGSNDTSTINNTVLSTPGSPPLAVSSCERFDGGGLNNWSLSGPGAAGTSSQTFNSSPDSMFLSEDTITVTSNPVDASAGLLRTDVWIRRGDDSFSENPEAGEDLIVDYKNNAGNWIELETFGGGGTQGQIFDRQFSMPADAEHSTFQVRFTLTGGSGADFDFWHVDDLCFIGKPRLTVVKSSSSTDVAPGDAVTFTISVENTGNGEAFNVSHEDDLGQFMYLELDPFGNGNPFDLIPGPSASGISLGTPEYSQDNGSSFTYTPSSGAGGAPSDFDGNVTDFIVPLNGTLSPGAGFDLLYRMQVQ